MRMSFRTLVLTALAVALLAASAPGASAQDAASFFRQNCASCHTIGGGRLTGPDLKDVTARKDRAWLTSFMASPSRAIDSGDPYAQQLLQEARGVVMPDVVGLTPQLAGALLDLIEAESASPKSQFAGVQVSTRPFTAADIARGRAIFRGDLRLAAGGPSCLSCHTVGGLGGLGGGQLAPDLTKVYERLQGRQGLATWLNAPPTPTMRALFAGRQLADPELQGLVAYFEDAARQGGQDTRAGGLAFALIGLGAAAAGLVLLNAAWPARFVSVRRALVERSRIARS